MTTAQEGGESSASRLGHTLPPGKVPVPIVQEAGWAENLVPDRPACSQSPYRLSYPPPTSWLYEKFLIRVSHKMFTSTPLFRASARITTPASARNPKERRTCRQLPTLYCKYCGLPKQQAAHINVTVSSNP